MRRSRQAVLSLALAVLSTACATTPPPAAGVPELDDFDLEGTEAVPAEEIEARIVTSGSSWLPFTARRYYDEGLFETDLKRILRLYQAEGYYKAKIAERKVVPSGEGVVDVTVRIEEGPPTRVTRLAIEGLSDVPAGTRAELTADLPLAEGRVFKEAAFEAIKSLLADRLQEAGWAEAEVRGTATVDLPSNGAEVSYTATTGPRLRFGEVIVAGSNQVPRKRIADEAKVAAQPGTLYSVSALEEAQRRIFDLGVFSAVRVSRGAPDRRNGTVPIVVRVSEAPFRTLRTGVGFGLDPRYTELPRLSGEWTNRNFFGGLRRVSALAQASLVYLPSLWELDHLDVAANTGLQLEQPEVIGKNTSGTASIGYERGVDTAFTYNAARGSVGLVYLYRRHLSFTPSYNLQVFKIEGPATVASTTTTQEATLDACARNNQVCLLAYLEQRLAWDRRDSATEPRRGAYLSISLQEGSRYLGGDYNYLRLLPEFRAYFPVGRVVVAGRVQAGLLRQLGGNDSSVLTRFFLGGSNSQRGFGNRQLAPAILECRPEFRTSATSCQTAQEAKRGDVVEALPVGGNGMLGGNLELRWPLPAGLGLVTFMDAGEVKREVSELTLSDLNLAAGIGLRYSTPFGPIRADFAYRLNTPALAFSRADDVLDPVGYPEPSISRFAFHFSIGEAF